MSTVGEAYAALTGSWLLARRQPGGLAYFNASREGFINSFWAVALVAPAQLGLEALGGLFATEAGWLRPLVVIVIAFVIDAVAFPLVMATVSSELGRSHRWVLFVVAYNWSGVLRMALFLPIAVATMLVPALHPLLGGVMILLLVYQAYVAHVALEVSPITAAGIILLDVLLDAVVALATQHLLGA
jgi:hypothetical protein